uniref:Inositol monophosphatase 3 n=1 Tax=Panagrolaimus sp. JU765 TaxID=591449 RepID=A0AC34Q730_9BILA
MFLAFLYLAYLIWSSDGNRPKIDVELREVMSYAVLAVEMGGHAVKKIYEENSLGTRKKGKTDVGKDELLTKADLTSNHLMLGLLERFPELTVISEEKSDDMKDKDVEKYRDDNYELWLEYKDAINQMPSKKYELKRLNMWIDPLDATQEYTEGLTQYVTTMACITVDGKPVFGAIYRPFSDETIIGLVDWGVLSTRTGKIKFDDDVKLPKKVMVSRSHAGKVQQLVDDALTGAYQVEAAGGSGYKTLKLINSTAEYYLHTTAIKKWDLCAADAIIRAAGGALIDLKGRPMNYSTNSDVLNKNGLIMSRKNTYGTYMKIKDYIH